MSIEKVENSRTSGIPFELFEFVYGDGSSDRFGYTDAEENLTLEATTYTPLAISRGAIKSKGRQKNGEMEIVVPRSSEIAGLFRGNAPRRVVFVRIWAGYLPGRDVPSAWSAESSTASLIWSGRILEASPKKGAVTLTCDTLGAGMRRVGLTRYYTRECPFVLYGNRCAANRANASYTATVATVGAKTLTFTDETWRAPREEVNFVGGILEWAGPFGTETRMVVSFTGGVLTADGPITDVAVSDTVTVLLGCQRVMASCTALHNNINNYGGTPFIPVKNPIGQNNHS